MLYYFVVGISKIAVYFGKIRNYQHNERSSTYICQRLRSLVYGNSSFRYSVLASTHLATFCPKNLRFFRQSALWTILESSYMIDPPSDCCLIKKSCISCPFPDFAKLPRNWQLAASLSRNRLLLHLCQSNRKLKLATSSQVNNSGFEACTLS